MVLSTAKLYSAQDHISCEVHQLVFDSKIFAKLLYISVGTDQIYTDSLVLVLALTHRHPEDSQLQPTQQKRLL